MTIKSNVIAVNTAAIQFVASDLGVNTNRKPKDTSWPIYQGNINWTKAISSKIGDKTKWTLSYTTDSFMLATDTIVGKSHTITNKINYNPPNSSGTLTITLE